MCYPVSRRKVKIDKTGKRVYDSARGEEKVSITKPSILRHQYTYRSPNSNRCKRLSENRKFKINGIKKARRFLTTVSILLNGIVTTNYDLVIEYALGTKEFNYGIF